MLKRCEIAAAATSRSVIVTSSDSPSTGMETTRLGATAYFRKPADLDEFMKVGEVVRRRFSTASAVMRHSLLS